MSELINKDPMTVGKILDKSVNFIFRNILWITLIGFLISLPELSFNEWMPDANPEDTFVLLKYKLILRVIRMVITPFLAGTVTILLGEHFCGRKIAWYQGFGKSIKKWIPLVLLQLVIGIVVGLGSILLLIPGLIAMCATACAIPAMMLEDLRPMKAFDRSWGLTKKNRLRIFGYLFINMVTVAIASSVIPLAVTMGVALDPIYKVGLSALIFAPFQALWPAIATLLFYDLRIRKEAMDLEEETNTISVETEVVA